MKRLLLLCILLGLLAAPAAIAASATGTGQGTYGSPYTAVLPDSGPGTVAAHVTWAPKKGVPYMLELEHRTIANDPYTVDGGCVVQSGRFDTPSGDWSCSVESVGQGGYWVALFWGQGGGKIAADLTLTTP